MAQFHSHLSDEIDQDVSTTATNILIILQFILKNKMIAPYLTIIWYHMDGCAISTIVNRIFIYYNVLLYHFLLLLKEQ